jgi:hypothetical protein
MSNRKVYQRLEEINKDAVVAEGFEDAYIGYLRRSNRPTIAAYDYEKCVDILMETEDWDRDKAVDFMENGVVATWLGNSTPAFLFYNEDNESDD